MNVGWLAMSAIGCTVLAQAVPGRDGPRFVVTHVDDTRVWAPRFAFRYPDPLNPQLVTMRADERLDEVVGDATNDWEIIARLAAWVCGRVPMDRASGPAITAEQYRSGPALLQSMNEGCSGYACGTFSRLFVDALASYGIFGRCMGVTATETSLGREYNHATSEVWSDHWGKWVYVDAELMLYYEQHGVPLGALELQDALKRGAQPARRHFDPDTAARWIAARGFGRWVENYFEQFQMPGYDLDNDHCRDDFKDNSVRDGREEGTTQLVYWPADAPWRPLFYKHMHYVVTANPADVNWPVNRVELRLSLVGERQVAVRAAAAPTADVQLVTHAPHMVRFLVRVDGQGEWRSVEAGPEEQGLRSGRFEWVLHAGTNLLESRVESALNRLGHVSSVRVESR